MAKNKSGNKIWIAGAVLGAVAGAAYALWKTPMSGQELRSKLSTGPVAQRDDVPSDNTHNRNIGDKILSKVEHTLAPVVGVELGKTANGDGASNGAVTEPIGVVEPAPVEETAVPDAAPVEAMPVVEEPSVTAASISNANSIRAKRFAWGDPAPETGLDPVSAEPMPEEVIPDPVPVPEPEPETVVAGATTTPSHTSETIRAKRFAWGDPAPEASAEQNGTPTAEQSTEVIETESRPLEPATSAAVAPGTNLRSFPKLGGLESK